MLDSRWEFRSLSRRDIKKHGQTQTPQTFTSPTAMFDTETYELKSMFCILDVNLLEELDGEDGGAEGRIVAGKVGGCNCGLWEIGG